MKRNTFLLSLISLLLLTLLGLTAFIAKICGFKVKLPATTYTSPPAKQVTPAPRQQSIGRLSSSEINYLKSNASSKCGDYYRRFIGSIEYWMYNPEGK